MEEVKASAPLINKIGLHARPSVKLTQLAKRYSSVIEVATNSDGPWTDAKSPVKIMRVKAGHGETLFLKAYGVDAKAAMTALIDLINRKFDEE